MSEEGGRHDKAAVEAAPDANETQRAIQVLLENLRHGRTPADESTPSLIDDSLELLHDYAALSRAKDMLMLQSRDKMLDVVFRAHISAMAGVLSLFLDPDLSYTWREASMVTAKAQGHGSTHAHSIRTWVLNFV